MTAGEHNNHDAATQRPPNRENEGREVVLTFLVWISLVVFVVLLCGTGFVYGIFRLLAEVKPT